MSRNARILGYMLGAALLAGGAALCMAAAGSGIGLLILGALVIAGLLLEPRYGRPRDAAPPQPGSWQRTGERFVDDESGEPVEVWYNPASGERRYTRIDA